MICVELSGDGDGESRIYPFEQRATDARADSHRAASFKRIAKELRAEARHFRSVKCPSDTIIARTLHIIAAHLDAEAKLLRSMR